MKIDKTKIIKKKMLYEQSDLVRSFKLLGVDQNKIIIFSLYRSIDL